MQQSNNENNFYNDNEINLIQLLNNLLARKFLIMGFTGVVTVLSIIYALNQTSTYKAVSSFTSPSSISVTAINKLNLANETMESIFGRFLTNLSSKDLQKEVFIDDDFLTKFNTDKIATDSNKISIEAFTKSVIIKPPKMTSEYKDFQFLTELPYSIEMEGANAEVISEYLNSLVRKANSKTILETIELLEITISNRIDEISQEHALLLEQAEKDRFSKIKRIKEEDSQKIRQINDQIDRVRYMAKENRLNQIVVLIDSAKLAKSLGIIENNFKLINDDAAKSELTIAIGERESLPEWYLYGEKALLQRAELLENRMSDDPFIPELVNLNNQLDEVQNNNLLKTLEMRQDDSPFIDEIVKLEIEKNKLKSMVVNMNGVNAMEISKIATIPNKPIKPNKRRIVLLAFIGSFMMSVFLALIIGALRSDEKDPIV